MRNHLLKFVFSKLDSSHPVFLNVTSIGRYRHFSTVIRPSEDGARVVYNRGLPHLILRLPSRDELCDFSLKPTTHRIEDLIQFIKDEDHGIKHVALFNSVGERLATTDTIESLLSRDFIIQLNSDHIEVAGVPHEHVTTENMEHISDVRSLVNQLYLGINIDEHHLKREKELTERLHHLKQEVAPYYEVKSHLANESSRKVKRLTWAGLAAMGLQFGLLCRLTWWEYSWDIMEPVTYFIGQSYIIVMFAYYVLTRQEYTYQPVFDRLYLWRFYKRAKKVNFSVEDFNKMQDEIYDIERELQRLRDPLQKRLPLQQVAFRPPLRNNN